MIPTPHQSRYSSAASGFTLVELTVVIVISALLIAVIISFMTGTVNQFAVSSVRGQLNAQLTGASNRIENDIRYSRAVLAVNSVTTNAAAPSGDGNWHSSEHQLVLETTARNSSGDPLGSDYTDVVDNIVYYLKDGTLYRRFIANPASGNRYSTTGCAASTTGGCPNDTAVAYHVADLSFNYQKADGTAAAAPADAATVAYTIDLQTKQSGVTITQSTTQNVKLMTAVAATPTPPTTPPTTPPVETDFSPFLPVSAGYGGVSVSTAAISAKFNGVLSLGKVNFNTASGSLWLSPKIQSANSGCGSSSVYPASCSGAGVNNNSYGTSIKVASICSHSSPITSGPVSSEGYYGNPSTTSSCTLPTSLPLVDKANLIATIPPGNSSSSASCSSFNPNWQYTGNVSLSNCTVTLSGNSVTYIKGNLSLSGNVTLKNTSSNKAVVIVNKQITSGQNLNIQGKIDLISMYSSDSSCTSSDSCNSVSNSTLYSSRFLDAISLGLNINMPNLSMSDGATLYAPFARISMGVGTNTFDIITSNDSRIIGQTINIVGNTVTWNCQYSCY